MRSVLALILGCGGDEPAVPTPCAGAAVVSIEPADTTIGVFEDATITVTLDGEADAVTLWVDGGVTPEPVSLGAGSTFTFTPPAPLEYGATYTATVGVCGEEAGRAAFTVWDGPVQVDLVGRTYAGEFVGDDVTWVHPNEDVSEELLGVGGGNGVLVTFTARDGDTADALVGIGTYEQAEVSQYSCIPPVAVEGIDLSADPAFVLGPLDLELTVGNDVVTIFDVTIRGSLEIDGSGVRDFDVAGMIDLRVIVNNQVPLICGNAETMGTECVPCRDQADDDPEPACVLIEAVDQSAPWVEGLALDPDLPMEDGC